MKRAAGILSACLSLLMAAGAGPMAASGRQAAPPAAQQASQQAPQPTFRTGVTIVPVDVRVLDRDGKPITDLKQSDFTVLEDSAPQEIRYFSARGLVPIPVPEATKPAVRTRSSVAAPGTVGTHLPASSSGAGGCSTRQRAWTRSSTSSATACCRRTRSRCSRSTARPISPPIARGFCRCSSGTNGSMRTSRRSSSTRQAASPGSTAASSPLPHCSGTSM